MSPLSKTLDRSRNRLIYWFRHAWDIPLLVACYLAFQQANAIQEDAYITFRTAFNFADHGVYSLNLDEKYPAATSTLYGFLAAYIRLIFGDNAISAIMTFNALLVAASCHAIARAFSSNAGHHRVCFLAVLIGLTGQSIRCATNGMETALLIAVISTCICTSRRSQSCTWSRGL